RLQRGRTKKPGFYVYGHARSDHRVAARAPRAPEAVDSRRIRVLPAVCQRALDQSAGCAPGRAVFEPVDAVRRAVLSANPPTAELRNRCEVSACRAGNR